MSLLCRFVIRFCKAHMLPTSVYLCALFAQSAEALTATESENLDSGREASFSELSPARKFAIGYLSGSLTLINLLNCGPEVFVRLVLPKI